jgi:spore germination cell wall hydrolase CwlJ-like protein
MKNLLDILLDALLTFTMAIIIGYILLSVGVYAVSAEEKPLTIDEQTVAITLLAEARGEKRAGLYAVACVIQKRADERKLTPAQVCKQPWQFSCWNKGQEKNLNLMRRLLKANTEQAKYAKMLARSICNGWRLAQTFTGDANHYHASYVTPYWIKGQTPTKIIGNHLFYKLP